MPVRYPKRRRRFALPAHSKKSNACLLVLVYIDIFGVDDVIFASLAAA